MGAAPSFPLCRATERVRHLNHVIEVLPGIHMPKSVTFCDQLRLCCDVCPGGGGGSLSAVERVIDMGKWWDAHLDGMPVNDEHLRMFKEEFVRRVIPDREKLPDGFETVPSAPTKKTIAALLQHNPFFSSAVETVHDANGKAVGRCISALPWDGQGKVRRSSLRNCAECLEKSVSRFHLTLNDAFDVESIKVYRWELTEQAWKEYETDEEHAVYAVIYVLMFYFEVWHVAIHIFHYLMVTGLYENAKGNRKLEDFAKLFEPDIVEKEAEVYSLLLNENGILVNGAWRSDREFLLDYLSDVIRTFGKFRSAKDFVNEILLAPTVDNPHWEKGWLEQFRKQSDLIQCFTNDVGQHMRKEKDYSMPEFDKNLSNFMKAIGEGAVAVRTIEEWLEIMSVTGLMHGCTLSASRLLFTKAFLTPAFPNATTFDKRLKTFMVTSFGTTVGLSVDHAVFSHTGLNRDQALKKVITMHTEKSESLKSSYMELVLKGGPENMELGWLLSDFFLDFIDNKQLTITAYI